ncbi:PREDICTED: A disintegrin and metalloproteinase with thrombospondin motifs 6-like [Priapulus caudatus]|uniref:A disintegrin and metalloproteinase with thrombospondin motifs 6-like n=1 Tax=Priapulus caudatus TaxID=37621 RepID=A0ABM1E8Y6_PRICU|nr:PREDICTED: A disintegrin and metalloproteinase with thrombospondin motifs 6-like [Priapulus caudatus]
MPDGYSIVIPQRIDDRGRFLSYDVKHTPRTRYKRHADGYGDGDGDGDGDDDDDGDTLFFKVRAYETDFHLNVTLCRDLVSRDFVVEHWGRNGTTHARRHQPSDDCHFVGHVSNVAQSSVAISTCRGMHGVILTGDEDFIIEPLRDASQHFDANASRDEDGQPHIIYKRSSLQSHRHRKHGHCGVKDASRHHHHKLKTSLSAKPTTRRQRAVGRRRRRRKRSVSREYFVETLVVVDKRMVGYHGNQEIEPYVLTVMNIVAKLYRHESIGNSVSIVITRLVLLTEDQPDLSISHHADRSLDSFCRWQSTINPAVGSKRKEDQGLAHHDNAVLITRYDICTYKNRPCGTLGLAPVAGMCEPDRSCSISEDIGLASAFTIAHEIGHNKLRELCTELWCINYQGRCVTNSIPAADGTNCSTSRTQDGWCYQGDCIAKGYRPSAVDGGWSDWSSWDMCTRTCGGGVEKSQRNCDKPRPMNDGKYCLGERVRYRSCNAHDCPINSTDFRAIQCASYNHIPFRKVYYNWVPFTGSQVKPCALNCLADGHHFYTERAPKVIDGTRCYPGQLDMCVNGDCKTVGCDGILNSNTVEDKCRVCGGDGSTCRTISGEIDSILPQGGSGHAACSRCMNGSLHGVRGFLRKLLDIPLSLVNVENSTDIAGHVRRVRVQIVETAAINYIPCCVHTVIYTARLPIVLGSGHAACSRCMNGSLHGVRGYVEVIHIPKGAVYIDIREVGTTRNYLSLKTTGEKYYINGAWTIDWPRMFEVAGTVFEYKRPEHTPEVLTARGPTTEDLVVMVLVQELKVAVRYQYNIPVDNDSGEPVKYSWQYTLWTECSQSCGSGNYNYLDCKRKWLCPLTCGSNVTATRGVHCVRGDTGATVDDSFCIRNERPASKTKCNTTECPPAAWKTGDWSQCSVSCGNGIKRRNVACKSHAGENSNTCAKSKRPVDQEMCGASCTECVDVTSVPYCPLVVKYKFCDRDYFRQLCCKTCEDNGQ